MKEKITDLRAGDEVWLYQGRHHVPLLVKVDSVKNKYLYINRYPEHSYHRLEAFDKVTGRSKEGIGKLKTDAMTAIEEEISKLNAVIRSADLDRASYYFGTSWSVEDKRELVALLHKLGKVPD